MADHPERAASPGLLSLSRDFATLLDDRETADVVFVVGKEQTHVFAHRVVLCARCGYYRQRKYELWVKPYSPMAPLTIKRPETDLDVFRSVLTYLYTGVISLATGSAFELLSVAEDLHIPELLTLCEKHLVNNLNSGNVCLFLRTAMQIKGTSAGSAGALEKWAFVDQCLQFIEENTEDIVKTQAFLQLSKEAMVYLISSDQFALPEDEVWACVLAWAKHGTGATGPPKTWLEPERKRVAERLSGVIEHIKLLLINSTLFAEEVEPTGAVPMELSLERYRFAAVPGQFDHNTDPRLQPRVSHRLFHGTQILTQQCVRFQHVINEWCGVPGQQWQLLYRASRDGFTSSVFHKRCDGKGQTIVVVKALDGSIFGGYADLSWASSISTHEGHYAKSTKAFVFSLARSSGKAPMRYPISKTSYALLHHANSGPCFGAGSDLFIANNCNQNESSYSNLHHSYGHEPGQPPRGSLASKKHFTVQDLEVFSPLEGDVTNM